MKTSGLMLVLAVAIAVPFVRSKVATVNRVSLVQGTAGRGRVNLNVDLANGTSDVNTPVCGSLDPITAMIVCQRLGFVITSQTSTVQLMSLPSGSTSALVSSFACPVGATTYSQCTLSFNQATPCNSSNNAALSCTLTPAQAAGIGVAVLLFCLLVTCLPLLICCCCCCGLCACISGSSSGYKNV